MSTMRIAAALDTLRALWALARTTSLFRRGNGQAVARATRAAMAVTPTALADLPEGGAEVWRAFRAVRRAKRLWPASVLCLQTALTLHQVLARRGIASAVRLGVHMNAGEVAAHAWVEVAGWAVDEARGQEQFAPLRVEQMREGQVTA